MAMPNAFQPLHGSLVGTAMSADEALAGLLRYLRATPTEARLVMRRACDTLVHTGIKQQHNAGRRRRRRGSRRQRWLPKRGGAP
jgi:hypothetical protein